MTVVTLEQAKTLAPGAFGLGAKPPSCDLCKRPWVGDATPISTPYGPFVVWCCLRCSNHIAREMETRRRGRS